MASFDSSSEDLSGSRKATEDLDTASIVDRNEESLAADDQEADFERDVDWEDHWVDYPERSEEEARPAAREAQLEPEAEAHREEDQQEEQQQSQQGLTVQEVWDQLSWDDVFAIMGISLCCKNRTALAPVQC